MTDSQQIALYSTKAKRLITGRKQDIENNQYPIYGLLQFASMVNLIWSDADKKNPFGSWFLIRIEARLKLIQEEIEKQQAWLKKVSDDGTGVDYKPIPKDADLQTIEVSFATPHAWSAMRQVKQFDGFVLQALNLNRVGLISRDEFYQSTRSVSRLLLGCFQEASLYTSTKLTSDCLKPPTEEAKAAFKQMGVVPPKVVSGEIKANFRPL